MMNQNRYEITTAKQLEVMASPVRQEIVDIVSAAGPLAVAEIAAALGRAADSLYYHVRALVEAELLIPCGTRKAFRQAETIYEVPGRPVAASYDPADREMTDIVVRSIAAMLRLTERNLRQAFEKGLVREEDGEPNLVHGRLVGWYTADEYKELQSRILAVFDEFETGHSPGADKELYALTSILVPLDSNRPRTDPDASGKGGQSENSGDHRRGDGSGERGYR